MKNSLFTCIRLTDDREIIEELKHGSLTLTAWQEGVAQWKPVIAAEQAAIYSELRTLGA